MPPPTAEENIEGSDGVDGLPRNPFGTDWPMLTAGGAFVVFCADSVREGARVLAPNNSPSAKIEAALTDTSISCKSGYN